MKVFVSLLIVLFLLSGVAQARRKTRRPKFVIQDSNFTRLCNTKSILTVNGEFPGPTIHAARGDTLLIDIINQSKENITIHWHGAKQYRFPWSDGPEFITQCPLEPGTKFTQKIVLTDELGTLWWHAHSEWSRATVHGALLVYPEEGTTYPFPKPRGEMQIVLGEWWNSDIAVVHDELIESGGDPEISDAYVINGQPGDLYNCSQSDTFRMKVEPGKTYLLRMVNAVMNNILFFSVANHSLTVVGSDGAYTKPLTSNVISIAPGQTMDILLEANQPPNRYYMAAKAYNGGLRGEFDTTTTTAILQYTGNYTPASPPPLPTIPAFNDSDFQSNYTASLRSLASSEHPIDVPTNISTHLFFTISINLNICPDNSTANTTCLGPGGNRFAATVNNLTFVQPRIDILQAYYKQINGVYGDDFPDIPTTTFNYTSTLLTQNQTRPDAGTKVNMLEYNENVELVFQGTSLVAGVDHPMHLHGYSFYVVGSGPGNFDRERDPLNYNLVDPPLQNTITVRRNGWAAIRFRTNNPGVWLMHCHFERHISWGMGMVFIVKNGKGANETILPPPANMPECPL
ncbi:hypothetical protein Leryth_023661 [Lithospermum erythrorhizon]|nr:hypothetical protein Leryth_023661 [Lithospermum erythrorhizon]